MDAWSHPPGGFTPDQQRLRRRRRLNGLIAGFVATTLGLGGAVSYRWVTTVTEVDQARAIELYRAERDVTASDEAVQVAEDPRRDPARPAIGNRTSSGTRGASRPEIARADGTAQGESPRRQDRASEPAQDRRPPQEGVYSWATEGYEQVSGARRQFPEETQRIITLEDDGSWTQHHYFSEERQIWTVFEHGSSGVDITQQRNEVTFGPVTKRSQIDFSPPMLAAPDELRVGYEWAGEWSGDTYGDYSSRVFEHTTMDIGGETVEVWGVAYVINLRGEQKGQVNAKVWFSPKYRLTVKEHYVQDVESGGSQYHAEWMQTLKSLDPKR